MTTNGNVRRVKIADLLPDKRNANLHTERGTYMVSRSLEKLGAGRSILIDKDNEIIAGNLTAEQAASMGLEEVIIVETDGSQLVAVQRTDMDLDDPATGAREMAYADNRAAEVSIDFDVSTIAEDISAGIDLGDYWLDWELETITDIAPPSLNELAEQYGEPQERDFWPFIRVQVSPETYRLWQSFLEQLPGEDETEKAETILRAVDASLFGSINT